MGSRAVLNTSWVVVCVVGMVINVVLVVGEVEPFVVKVVGISLINAEMWMVVAVSGVAFEAVGACGAWFTNVENWMSLLVASRLELANNDLLVFVRMSIMMMMMGVIVMCGVMMGVVVMGGVVMVVGMFNMGICVSATDMASFGPDELGEDSLLVVLS